MKKKILLCACFVFFQCFGEDFEEGRVTVTLQGQFGNKLFEIAAGYAYALDNGLCFHLPAPVFYRGSTIPKKILKCSRVPVADTLKWKEPNFNYTPIPLAECVHLSGYFQSEKYFLHRREEILDLFAPPFELVKEILDHYSCFQENRPIIGVQIRDYRREFPKENYHPTVKRSYFAKAIRFFPEDALFIVSSNNPALAKECMEELADKIVYLNEADPIKEFYILSLCDSFIISNSSFGWWAAWLSTAESKIVIAPDPWFSAPYDTKAMTKDLLPKDWIVLPVGE